MNQNIETVHVMERPMIESDLLKILTPGKALIITDDQVFYHHGNRFSGLPFVVIPSGEPSKSFKEYLKILDVMIALDLDRDDYIVALGGGVVGDLAGYAAATFKRGVRLIQVPTTLLAMVDSCIGGKVAINHQGGKNNVGTFYKAHHVMIDSSFLETLPKKEKQNGMAEVLKYAMGFKPDLLETLNGNIDLVHDIVLPCIEIKRQLVAEDECDQSARRLLNFGHTIGHAIEQHGGFKSYSHGEAVAIGMAYQLKYALLNQKLSLESYDGIMALYNRYELPKRINQNILEDIVMQMCRDKKNKMGKIFMIELKGIGELEVVARSTNEVLEILNRCHALAIIPAKLKGNLTIPPSKSYAHRAIISAALTDEKSIIGPLSASEDIASTIHAMAQLGAVFSEVKPNYYEVHNSRFRQFGPENQCLSEQSFVIDCAESGSTLRFLIPFSTFCQEVTFTGKGRLGDRPLFPYYAIFDGQKVSYQTTNGKLPLTVKGGISPSVFTLPGNVSSQFVTGLMFVLPLLNGDSEIVCSSHLESEPYVNLTIDVLRHFGIQIKKNGNGHYVIKGNQTYKGCQYEIEGDYSQAAFWLVANTLGSHIEIKGLVPDSKQGDRRINDSLQVLEARSEAKRVIDVRDIPDLLPILTVKAAVTNGETKIIGAERVRLKESDRVRAISIELKKMGAQIEERPDGLVIQGIPHFKSAVVDAWNDHRIAMALAVASTMTEGPLYLYGADSVKKSYPEFWCDFKRLGGRVYE